MCIAVPGKKEAGPELDFGGMAGFGTAAPGYLTLYSCTGQREADPELDCGGVAKAGTAAPGYQSVYCFTWQKGGRSGAGLWRCGQSRHSCTRVSECTVYLAKRRRIRSWIVELWPEPAQLHRVSEYVLLCHPLYGFFLLPGHLGGFIEHCS
jgi:hypothetical protein